MHVTRRNRIVAGVCVGLLGILFLGRVEYARAAFPDIETFESNPDPYTPTSDGVNDPGLSGSPPSGWLDQRNGGAGVIEEVPSGFLGISTGPTNGGSGYGIVYPANPEPPPVYTHAPNGAPAFSTTPLPNAWSYRADVFTDSSIAANNNGIPDFWWTNCVTKTGTSDYLTETGFTGEVLPSGQWRFTTTKTLQPYVDLAADTWYTLEVNFDTSDTQLAAHLNIYNQSQTALLYTYALTTLFPEDTPPQSADVGGPLDSCFTYFDDNLKHLAVDNVGVQAPVSLAESAVAGDMNANGVLDSGDRQEFNLALSNLSATKGTIGMGDINGDGLFNYFDIAAFQDLQGSIAHSFNFGAGYAAAVQVPEPSTLALGLVGLVGLLFVRRRK